MLRLIRGSVSRRNPAASAAVVLWLTACGGTPPADPGQDPLPTSTDCTVSSISDGDTLRCADGRIIRLLLIDTPEMAQVPHGEQARDVLVALAPVGTLLTTEYDVERIDPFGRDLTYLYLDDGTMVNEEIVRLGFAVTLVFPPNGKHLARIEAALADAQTNARGLWATWAFACLPRDFRAGNCT